jgi:YVTN family beta-propeller protein
MKPDSRIMVRRRWALGGLVLGTMFAAVAGCGGDDGGDDGGNDDGDDDPFDGPVLARPSKSGTIAVTSDDAFVAMVNPEDDSVSIFDTEGNTRVSKVPTGDEPSAVVFHPDNRTAFVANRAAATVVKIDRIDATSPQVGEALAVGSEPVGLALSPTGKYLYVAELAEGRVAQVDTETMAIVATIDGVNHPRALAVTNDLDKEDGDELLVVPEFFGEAPEGAVEATDTSRQGRVRVYDAVTLEPKTPIIFAPLDSGFANAGAPAGTATAMTSPNQLWAVRIVGNRIYVPSVSVSPQAPINFQTNVQPVAYVGDLEESTPVAGAVGTANLAKLVNDQAPAPVDADDPPRFFLADTVDVDFIGEKVAYYLSRGADVVQRVTYDGTITIGSDQNEQIDLNVVPQGSTLRCQTPTGIVTAHGGGRAWVNCWVTRSLGVLDFTNQSLAKTVESTVVGTSEADVQAGRRFFYTARGRWSKDAWSGCASCHPDGLSDNVTWSFGAGPRQTTAMDGSYSHGPGAQKQRVFNWTGIFDELHDFERNTRGTSGGLGAITVPGSGACNVAGVGEARIDFEPAPPAPPAPNPGGLGLPVRVVQDETPGSCTDDWDKVEAFARTIRPPRALRFLDGASVARGAELFGVSSANNSAGCVKCHGGAGWTASRIFFTPSEETNDQLDAQPFSRPAAWPAGWSDYTVQIQGEPGGVPIEQVACSLRNIGTFGPEALEKRIVVNAGVPSAVVAQGAKGYNVPSLYGMSLGAPYLHHGGAATLEALFDESNAAVRAHITAGNPNWILGRDDDEADQAKKDLIAFLLSIDASTPEQPLPDGFDGCPAGP